VKLPAQLTRQIEARRNDRVVSAAAVSGGCISNTARIDFASGAHAFLKWSSEELPGALLSEEARSLQAIAATETVRVPQVLELEIATDAQWLLLEWLEPGARRVADPAALGEQLAALHRHSSAQYGWPSSNFIGSLPQSNTPTSDWSNFWREHRLRPQITMAAGQLSAAERNRLERLADACERFLGVAQNDGPSLLHGDLWSGNLHVLTDGSAALIDPSSYYGHREVDLAMSRLFGGFPEAFYEAYQATWPSAIGLEERLLIYQLYYLLVHVNLFGGSYRAQTMAVVAALGF
jgi:fructosamine-3-kinase